MTVVVLRSLPPRVERPGELVDRDLEVQRAGVGAGRLAVDLAVCVRTLMLMLEIFDPREFWLRRRTAVDDAMP